MIARIRKLASVTPPEVKKRLGKFPFEKANKKAQQEVAEQLLSALDINYQVTLRYGFETKTFGYSLKH